MCTNVTIKSTNNDIFFGRTLDLSLSMFGEDPGVDLNVKLTSIPKGVMVDSQLKPWKSKHHVLGICTEGTSVLYDGINEHGLIGDCQVLIESNRGDKEDIINSGKIPLIGEEFVTYILTNFKNVQEIKDNYSDFALVEQPYIYEGQDLHFPLHYTFIDETGAGIVLEPVLNGEFKLYDYIGVTTNSPEYGYHTVNIRNYIGLQDIAATKKEFKDNLTLEPIEGGSGYGLMGIPGDYTSPSRFIRGFYYKNMIDSFESSKGINALYSLFRPLIIPRGLEHAKPGVQMTDYTRFWSGYDLTNRTVYVQTGEGLAITSKKMDNSLKTIEYYDIRTDDNISFL